MPRPSRPPHQLRLRNHHGRAVVTYRGKVYPFGAWDVDADRPSPEALDAFHRQVGVWSGEPVADVQSGDFLASVWAAWMASPHAPADRHGDNGRIAKELFGTAKAPGPFRSVHADKLTAGMVLAWQDSLCARKLSRYTVNRMAGFLRRCLKWGRVAGMVPAAVVADVDTVPKPPPGSTPAPRKRQAVSEEEVFETARRLASSAGDVIRLLWWTGARPSEVCGLTVGMVKASGSVRPSKGQAVKLGAVWAAVLATHKTADKGKERCLFFGPRAQEVLGPHLEGKAAGALVFATARGRQYSYKLLGRYVKTMCDRRGVPRWDPYSVRHACAERVQAHYSDLLPGAGYLAAQAYLGHTARGVTGGYAGADWTTAAKVAAELG